MGFDLSPGERAGHGRAEENIDTEHHLKIALVIFAQQSFWLKVKI